jgi:plasmid stabilization system protein ParE
MKYKVIIHPDAEIEIAEAFLHILADSPLNAGRWLRGLYKAIAKLEIFPNRCGIARESTDLPVELRQFMYKSHRVIFQVAGTTYTCCMSAMERVGD